MAETPAVCPQLHMPLQSGSDRILKAMRRSYRSARYLDILAEVRACMPDAAITTDIIVGFPGETDQDFEQTLDVVARAQFAGAFTFQYSPRPGTPAASLPDQVPAAVVRERYQRLQSVVEDAALAGNRAQIGRTVEVLVAAGEGRKDVETHRLSGRARDGRLVHLRPTGPCVDGQVRPGDVVTTVVTDARAAPPDRGRRSPVPPPDHGRGPACGRPASDHTRRRSGPSGHRSAREDHGAGVGLQRLTGPRPRRVNRKGPDRRDLGPDRCGGVRRLGRDRGQRSTALSAAPSHSSHCRA